MDDEDELESGFEYLSGELHLHVRLSGCTRGGFVSARARGRDEPSAGWLAGWLRIMKLDGSILTRGNNVSHYFSMQICCEPTF